ncbi:MAG: DUF4331 domain-containing protein [Actinomycetota bacterium]|nr:DUF4331 domain-containing protein [Actinomycetota bacterium]
MSSHREAPEISKDPNADSTDVYAFVSPDDQTTVTLIANYIPLESPDGGPNFYEFDDNVGYNINIDHTGTGTPDITYSFKFTTLNTNPNTFLYNTGPINNVTDSSWNRKQTYTLTRTDFNGTNQSTTTVLGTGLAVPPCNIGPFSTPDYKRLVSQGIHQVTKGGHQATVFAGQRAEGFYVDLGAVFDLGDLRPFEKAHAGFMGSGLMGGMPGVNSTDAVNVHSLAIQVPITEVVAGGTMPTSAMANNAVIGVWTSATRPALTIHQDQNRQGGLSTVGAPVQVSRLANPLVNELLIALANKDEWNANLPKGDANAKFLTRFQHPELAMLLPVLYPGATFQNLAAFNATNGIRTDIVAILLTGIPTGVIPGFQNHLAGANVFADMQRLNVAIPPAKTPNNLGLLGNDVAGYPNGRRVFDDAATISLRAVAGAVLKLTVPAYNPDPAAGAVNFGLTDGGATQDATDLTANGTEFYLNNFPYLGTPHAGYDTGTALSVTGSRDSKY